MSIFSLTLQKVPSSHELMCGFTYQGTKLLLELNFYLTCSKADDLMFLSDSV